MNKKLVYTLVTLAMLTSACGSNKSYRALPIGGGALVDNADVDVEALKSEMEVADVTVEAKATELMTADVNNSLARNTQLSTNLQNEVQGLTVNIIKDRDDNGMETGKALVKLNITEMKNGVCTESTVATEAINTSDLTTQFVKIKDKGRIRCIENCDNAVLVLETTGVVDMIQESGKKKKEYQQASVPVILKKNSTGVLVGVNAESDEFADVVTVEGASSVCILADAQKAVENADAAIAASKKKQEEAIARAKAIELSGSHTTTIGTGGAYMGQAEKKGRNDAADAVAAEIAATKAKEAAMARGGSTPMGVGASSAKKN